MDDGALNLLTKTWFGGDINAFVKALREGKFQLKVISGAQENYAFTGLNKPAIYRIVYTI